MRRFALLTLCWFTAFILATTAQASERDFYVSAQGKWSGRGEIIAGKYKNTRFSCVFQGISPDRITGLNIDGSCRVGIFSQPMNASVERALAGYTGKFMDGAAGNGLDVVGGRFSGSQLAIDIRRKDLHGVMFARMGSPEKMHVTVSVRVGEHLIPVIALSLERVGGSIKEAATGSTD